MEITRSKWYFQPSLLEIWMKQITKKTNNKYHLQSSLLEMWRFNAGAIKVATREEVIEGVNRLERRWGNHKTWNVWTLAISGIWKYCHPHNHKGKTFQPLVWFLSQLLFNARRGDQERERANHFCHQCSYDLGARGQWRLMVHCHLDWDQLDWGHLDWEIV